MYWLEGESEFPDPARADPDGLLAAGDTLSPQMVLRAYRRGIFPWYHEEPVLWFSPPVRWALPPAEIHVGRSLKKIIRRNDYEVRFNSAFDAVIEACAKKREGETWITPEMTDAYKQLHRQGAVHSVEAWRNGCLEGGLYGVATGHVFTGESMFYFTPDASKVALVALANRMAERGFQLLDAQVHTDHLERFGAKPYPRKKYLSILEEGLQKPPLVLDP